MPSKTEKGEGRRSGVTQPQSPQPRRPHPAQAPLLSPRATAPNSRQARDNAQAAAFRHLTRGAFLGEARPPGELTDAPSLGDSDPKSGWLKWLSSLPPAWVRVSPCCHPNSYLEAAFTAWGSRPRHSCQRARGERRRDCSVRGTRGARGRVGVTVPARATAAAAA